MKMEWTKLPTTLITKRYSDYELVSILKFQLVWAINEEKPDEQTCLRYMTRRQFQTAMTYIDSIASRVSDDVSQVLKKRDREKIRYNKIKDLKDFLPADCQQTASSLSPKIREDKIREDNNPPVSKDTVPPKGTKQVRPTLKEVAAYCKERGGLVEPNKWYDYYSSNGWKVGKNPMRDWKACVRNWERNATPSVPKKTLSKSEEILEHNMNHLKELFEGDKNA